MAVIKGRLAGDEVGAIYRTVDGGSRSRKYHLPDFAACVMFGVLIVTQPPPSCQCADDLFADEAGADFDGCADNYRSVGRHQAMKVLQNASADSIRTVFEHFHAEDNVKGTVVLAIGQMFSQVEGKAWKRRESASAVLGLLAI